MTETRLLLDNFFSNLKYSGFDQGADILHSVLKVMFKYGNHPSAVAMIVIITKEKINFLNSVG